MPRTDVGASSCALWGLRGKIDKRKGPRARSNGGETRAAFEKKKCCELSEEKKMSQRKSVGIPFDGKKNRRALLLRRVCVRLLLFRA